jgi:3-hydroxyisobutyrate dehydrogenase-like beta-hydroxyacid dehydrogenase
MRIAVIAPGSMGAGIAQRLHARGADVAVTLAGRGPASAARAAGLARHESEAALADWADVVLSILPPGDALALAERLAPVLCPRAGSARPVLYADCNAVSPATVRQVAAALPGVAFADIGIIGGPPGADDAGPRLYVSGETAAMLAKLTEHGIDLRPIAGGIGAASALKMSYAGITKGLVAIAAASVLGATAAGAAAALRAELAESQPKLLASLQSGVPGMFDKAYRWVAEMQEISAFLSPMPGACIYDGAAELYAAIAADRAAATPDGAVACLAGFFSPTPEATTES